MKNLSEIMQFEELDNLEFLARKIVEGFIIGLHRSPFHGFSVEFAEHRQYNSGESTKYIDWKLYARSEKLFVKQFEAETNLRAHIVLDTSSSMLFPYKEKRISKLGFSVFSTAALIHLLRRQRDAVALCTFSDQIDILTPAKISAVHARYLYIYLNKLFQEKGIALGRGTKISEVLHQLAENLHRRSLVVIFTDLIGMETSRKIFEALQHLHYNKHEIILYIVRDHSFEKEFNFASQPTRLIDMETGDTVKLNPLTIRQQYQEQQEKLYHELRLYCNQYSIDLIEADIQNDFREVLLPYLVKRSKLF